MERLGAGKHLGGPGSDPGEHRLAEKKGRGDREAGVGTVSRLTRFRS